VAEGTGLLSQHTENSMVGCNAALPVVLLFFHEQQQKNNRRTETTEHQIINNT
jgi:hypothetical protein